MKHLFLLLIACLQTSCLTYRSAGGDALILVGTNATRLRAGDLEIDGLNQSESTGKIVRGVIIDAAIGAGADVIKGTVNKAAEVIAQ
jgi:hypothetical protein